MRRLSEDFVKARVFEWLGRQDYVVVKARTLAEHGVDIKAKKARSHNFFLIECKGDPEGGKNIEKNRSPALLSALGEILLRMTYAKHCRYAVALPEGYKAAVLRRVPWRVARNLGLEFFLVRSTGRVERFTWRQLKPLRDDRRPDRETTDLAVTN